MAPRNCCCCYSGSSSHSRCWSHCGRSGRIDGRAAGLWWLAEWDPIRLRWRDTRRPQEHKNGCSVLALILGSFHDALQPRHVSLELCALPCSTCWQSAFPPCFRYTRRLLLRPCFVVFFSCSLLQLSCLGHQLFKHARNLWRHPKTKERKSDGTENSNT